jgi:hypothetical protein
MLPLNPLSLACLDSLNRNDAKARAVCIFDAHGQIERRLEVIARVNLILSQTILQLVPDTMPQFGRATLATTAERATDVISAVLSQSISLASTTPAAPLESSNFNTPPSTWNLLMASIPMMTSPRNQKRRFVRSIPCTEDGQVSLTRTQVLLESGCRP